MNDDDEQTDFSALRGRKDLRAVTAHVVERGVVGGTIEVARRVPRRLKWIAYYGYHRRFDRLFDRRHGVSTCGVIDQSRLTVSGHNQTHGLEYEPTPVRAFRRMLASLPEDLSQFTFVDLGSGKGRSLLLASHYGFKKVIGVEFAHELHETAVANVARYHARGQRARDIEVVRQDAATYEIPDGPIVFYLYYPFRRDVLVQVLANIEDSQRASPRKMFFINRLDKSEWLDDTRELFAQLDFVRHTPMPAPSRLSLKPPFVVANYESTT